MLDPSGSLREELRARVGERVGDSARAATAGGGGASSAVVSCPAAVHDPTTSSVGFGRSTGAFDGGGGAAARLRALDEMLTDGFSFSSSSRSVLLTSFSPSGILTDDCITPRRYLGGINQSSLVILLGLTCTSGGSYELTPGGRG